MLIYIPVLGQLPRNGQRKNDHCWVTVATVTLATIELLRVAFSVGSVPRCFKQNESIVGESLEGVQRRRVGGWCEVAGSLWS
jgi:hypothetical protein